MHPTARLTAIRAVVIVTLSLGVAVSMPGSAAAEAVGCGSVLTADTTLSTDVVGCQGTGLVIGAPGITVDLGGHTVDGLGPQGGPGGQVGIDDSAGYDGVTIRNGSVKDFHRAGVWLANADGARVQGLSVELSTDVGILVDGGSGTTIRDNVLSYPGQFAITLRGDVRGTTVAGNRVVFPGTAGIVLEAGRFEDTTIDGNQVSGALADERGGGGILVGRDDSPTSGTRLHDNDVHENYDRGILVGAASTATTITDNAVTDNTYAGVENAGDRTTIRANRFHDDIGLTGVAIWNRDTATAAIVDGNSIRGVGFAGVDDYGSGSLVRLNAIDGRLRESTFGFWAGIVVRPESTGARVVANAVTHQSQDGITVSGRGTVVSANVVAETTYGDAIRVEPAAAAVTLSGNVARHAQDDGIEVASPAATLARNVAVDNGDLGILAVPGVTDGGGNRAAGNGDPAQCSGVTCAPLP